MISVFPAITFRGKQNQNKQIERRHSAVTFLSLKVFYCLWMRKWNKKWPVKIDRDQVLFSLCAKTEVEGGKRLFHQFKSLLESPHPHTMLCAKLVVWNKMRLSDDLIDWNRERAAPSIRLRKTKCEIRSNLSARIKRNQLCLHSNSELDATLPAFSIPMLCYPHIFSSILGMFDWGLKHSLFSLCSEFIRQIFVIFLLCRRRCNIHQMHSL